jgi:glyoxylate carboligase
VAVQIVSGAAHRSHGHFQVHAQSAQHALGLFGNLGTDAVTGQYCDFMSHDE